ncbi:hypothetical protein DSO57_1021754 [Entomophthora muscae]|uniref:Uncharacterized protein n=1 Tax=Entomophthora muscae TaxID=34485 RepID=A0ACC2S588_9FUNG|nr:hypothetical protein DSO57_1021754 [Entomophthora muscae]
MSLVYGPVYFCDGVPYTIMEKVKPVLDTTCKPYVSDNKGQDDNKQPKYFQTIGGQQVLKKFSVFYKNVPILSGYQEYRGAPADEGGVAAGTGMAHQMMGPNFIR